jgi:hypothetical protein
VSLDPDEYRRICEIAAQVNAHAVIRMWIVAGLHEVNLPESEWWKQSDARIEHD